MGFSSSIYKTRKEERGMTNIAFVSNDYKTDFFIEVAKSLVKKGINVNWFVFNEKYFELLKNHFDQENILYVNKTSIRGISSRSEYDLKINELIYQDHSLRYQQSWASDYLHAFYTLAKEFILKKQIRFIFGELARAHECLLLRLCKQELNKSCYYLSPNMVRIPNGFFAFFTDEAHYALIGGESPNHSIFPKNIVVEKPQYFEQSKAFIRNSYTFRGRLKKIHNFFFKVGYDKNDPSKFENRLTELKLRFIREVNKELYKSITFDKFESLPEKFIFFPLQRYPEASVEVFGRYSENQYQHILDLWRVMPNGWGIIVKEHSTAIGERPLKFYRNLRKFKGIFLVSHELDSHDLINKSAVTASVTGTAALEAALLGKTSIVFGNPFFTRLASVLPVRKEHFQVSRSWINFLSVVEADKYERIEVDEYLSFIEAHSFPGVISDPVSDPDCMKEENIELVSSGFSKILSQLN